MGLDFASHQKIAYKRVTRTELAEMVELHASKNQLISKKTIVKDLEKIDEREKEA